MNKGLQARPPGSISLLQMPALLLTSISCECKTGTWHKNMARVIRGALVH